MCPTEQRYRGSKALLVWVVALVRAAPVTVAVGLDFQQFLFPNLQPTKTIENPMNSNDDDGGGDSNSNSQSTLPTSTHLTLASDKPERNIIPIPQLRELEPNSPN